MKRARDIIGLPVVCSATGKQVGTAKDLLLSEEWQAVAIVLEPKQWFSGPACICWEHIRAIGDDAVMIGKEEAIQPLESVAEGATLLDGPRKLRGLPVLTANGMQLGLIEDVYLEPGEGKQVIGFELTEGFISDLREGRKRLPLPDSVTIGEDAVIVPAGCGERLDEIFVSNEE
ncbi:PRC-barrel domain-containing protein [Paenibacillus ginsengihumi]|uniref:PRC-barrel domain-containing protein n=1 Tax=Paenibacillus ginsengihumi TaxID=431596 RepID=UPI00036E3DC1|nr:PRC-barrel domain-containing protein [Paenibacillus ginsengihumi]